MYGQFVYEIPEEIDKDLSWKWFVQSNLKVQTEATICAAEEQVLRKNYTKNNIDKTSENPLCRMCGERGEAVQHIICECKKLAQCEYKRTHETVAKLVHWKLCKKHNRERKEKWYEHCPEGVVEDDDVKLIWDINIQCDKKFWWTKRRNHASSSMLLYQVIVGYVRKKSQRLKNFKI